MASAVAVLTVALALATVAFAVVDGVLFRALPYERPSELFVLRAENRARVGAERPPVAAQEVEAWVGAVPEIRHGVVDAHLEEFPIDGIPASLARIDERFLEVLGVRPLLGGFTAEDFLGDGDPERGANRPVLLSHRLWRDWTGGDPHVVGRTWLVSQRRGRPYSIRIAGVLGPDFVFPADTGGQPDLLAPLGRLDPLDPRRRFILLFRLEPTVDAARVRARLERATRDLASLALPADPHGSHGEHKLLAPFERATLEPLNRSLATRQRSSFRLLFLAALGLLVLACFNIGGLVAARNLERAGDLRVLRTLGAGVRHLAALQISEVAMLASLAGVLALAIAQPILSHTVALLPESYRLGQTPAIDWRAAAAALALSFASALTISLLPLRSVVTLGLPTARTRRARAAVERRGRAGVVFLSVQVGCGFVLLICGVLTIASLGAAMNNESGYARDRMILVEAFVRAYVSPDDARQQLEESVTFLQGLPGIDRVAVSTIQATFLRPIVTPTPVLPEGWLKPADSATVRQVSETFFEVMGLRLVTGQWPQAGEWGEDSPAAIVSVSAARAFWPDGRAVGRTLVLPPSGQRKVVIGVVADARFTGLDVQPASDVYVPNPVSRGRTGLLYHARTSESPETVLPAVVRELSAKGLRVDRFSSHAAGLFESIRDRILPAWLFGLMGVSALAILAIGVGGLLAMASSQRTHEVGIRLALGSTRSQIVGLLLKEPLVSVIDGLFVGAVAGWWLVAFLDSHLYGVRAHHPGLWVTAIVTLGVIAVLAAAVPAIRAANVNPLESLRTL